MRNFKKLSREELKNVLGGQSCSIAIQGSDGSWTTRTGECKRAVNVAPGKSSTVEIIADQLSPEMYCETGLGNIPLTSNGGRSRCS